MAISPDTKDWTWVLERPCPECGFNAESVAFDDIPRLVRENAARWAAVLKRPEVARRPDAQTWSPLEYAAHVRDVFRLFELRLGLMLNNDDPMFPDWNQDATAEAERYGEQVPATVALELTDAAASVANAFAAVARGDRHRPGRRSDGSSFTVTTLGRYFVHDPIHHLHDVAGDVPHGRTGKGSAGKGKGSAGTGTGSAGTGNPKREFAKQRRATARRAPKRRWRDMTPGQQTAMLVSVSVQLSLAATAWTDLWRRPAAQVNGRKGVWGAIIGINFMGPIAYFVWGRRRR